MDLQHYRREIDRIDGELVRLFAERMELSAQVAEYKKEKRLPIRDARRERQKLAEIENRLPEELREYGAALFTLILELSRSRQERTFASDAALDP